ncbi:MAG TPA: DnaJ domain-containing protein [Arenimonas sp.]|nr:DnaJ domain-containing protein [Arenimonas sp.]
MTVGHSSAIEQALALLRAPALLAAVRQRPLPGDLPQLFRLAAGDVELFEQVESATGESRAQLAEAATFYLQQVLFAPGADSYRVLGVAPDAAEEQIKQHYRLLQRWLHPDRNHDEWDAVYADRVNRAWQDLRTPERRAEYDRRPPETSASAAVVHATAPGGFRARPLPPIETPVLSSRAVRRLPWLVLGSLGVLATVGLGGAWYLQRLEPTGAVVLQAAGGVQADRPDTAATPIAAHASSSEESLVARATPAEIRDAVQASSMQFSEDRPAEPPVTPLAVNEPAGRPPSPAPSPAPSTAPALPAPPPAAPTVAIARAELLERAPREPAPTSKPAMTATTATSPPEPATVARAAPTQTPDAAFDVSDAPVPVVAQAPVAAATDSTPTPDTPLLDEREAMALLEQFQRSYGAGDLQALMRLFTGDARNNRGGLNAISEDYEQLFRASDSRRIEWSEPVWLGNGDRGSVSARYRATVLPSGELRPNTVEGDIRFDLRRDGDVARIERVRHQ